LEVGPIASEQQSLITLSINGINYGVWDKRSGGEAVAKELKYRPGGMGNEVAYTTLPSPTTVTVSRVMENDRDWEFFRNIAQVAGRLGASVSEQPLDNDGNPWGNPVVYSGIYLGVKQGNVDWTSDNPRMIEIDVSVVSIA